MEQLASSPDPIYQADTNRDGHDEDLTALLEWSSFEPDTSQNHVQLFDSKPAASRWHSSHISSDSSHLSPTTAETKLQSPLHLPHEVAWSKIHPSSHGAPSWSTGAPPVVAAALASQNSAIASHCSTQMSWSLARGLSQAAPTPRASRSGEAQCVPSGAPPTLYHPLSHPLTAQLSGNYHQAVQQAAPSPRGGKSPFSAHLLLSQASGHALALPAMSTMQSQQQAPSQQQQRASSNLCPTAALKQLTEDELRRNVQRQVATLVQRETDRAQLSWLHELLELTKTAALPLLGTLRQQLDVLLHPVPLQAAHAGELYVVPTLAPSSSVNSDGWNAVVLSATGNGSALLSAASQQPVRHGGLKPSPSSLQLFQMGPSGFVQQQRLLSSAGGDSPKSSAGLLSLDPTSGSCQTGVSRKRTLSATGFDAYSNLDTSTAMTGVRTGFRCSTGSENEAVDHLVVKAEPLDCVGGNMGGVYEHRWRRRQNNFVMTIDDIVKKVRCQGVRRPPPPAPPLVLTPDMIDAGGRHINAVLVRQVFDKPLKTAADMLSVSVMSLKRTCRKMGVSRWPYRKLASLRELSTTVRDDDLEQQLQPGDKEAVMQYIEAEIAAILQEPDCEFDPLLADLRKAKIHMKYEKWGRKAYGCARPTSAVGAGAGGGAAEADDEIM